MTNRSRASALAHVRTVGVGTTNGPKLEAVRRAFLPYAPEVEVIGHAVESGVSDQPVGYAEIASGARTRARAAFATGVCELAVGIEDGLVEIPELGDSVLNVGVAVVSDGERYALGLSSGFAYPPGCTAPALSEREPIGGIFDALWHDLEGTLCEGPSALSVGNIGKLSLGALTRAEYASHAVLCALIRFLHPDLYFGQAAKLVEESSAFSRGTKRADQGVRE